MVLEKAKNGEVTTDRGQKREKREEGPSMGGYYWRRQKKKGEKGGRAKYGQNSTEGGHKKARRGLKRVNKEEHKAGGRGQLGGRIGQKPEGIGLKDANREEKRNIGGQLGEGHYWRRSKTWGNRNEGCQQGEEEEQRRSTRRRTLLKEAKNLRGKGLKDAKKEEKRTGGGRLGEGQYWRRPKTWRNTTDGWQQGGEEDRRRSARERTVLKDAKTWGNRDEGWQQGGGQAEVN
jgi:hypothetical protein